VEREGSRKNFTDIRRWRSRADKGKRKKKEKGGVSLTGTRGVSVYSTPQTGGGVKKTSAHRGERKKKGGRRNRKGGIHSDKSSEKLGEIKGKIKGGRTCCHGNRRKIVVEVHSGRKKGGGKKRNEGKKRYENKVDCSIREKGEISPPTKHY